MNQEKLMAFINENAVAPPSREGLLAEIKTQKPELSDEEVEQAVDQLLEMWGNPVSSSTEDSSLSSMDYGDSPRFSNFDDSQQGNIRLEMIYQDLYDTQRVPDPYLYPMPHRKEFLKNPAKLAFFLSPGGRPECFTNMATAGQLSWPKRFFACGITVDLDVPLSPAQAGGISVCFSVGEKDFFQKPLANFEHREDNIVNERARYTDVFAKGIHEEEKDPYTVDEGIKGYQPPAGSIQIPPVQNFRVLLGVHRSLGADVEVRVTLHGILAREIQ